MTVFWPKDETGTVISSIIDRAISNIDICWFDLEVKLETHMVLITFGENQFKLVKFVIHITKKAECKVSCGTNTRNSVPVFTTLTDSFAWGHQSP